METEQTECLTYKDGLMGYTKLFSSIVTSTIWRADKETKIVWITMLATANALGQVDGSIPGLAAISNVTIPECEHALQNLLSPDAYSRTKQHDGRRIVEIDGGWQILNYEKYRNKSNTFDKEYFRIKQQQHRAKNSPPLTIPQREETEAYTEAENQICQSIFDKQPQTYTEQEVSDVCYKIGIPENKAKGYFDHFNAQGWIRANNQPIKNLTSHINCMWDKGAKRWVFEKAGDNPKTPNIGADGLTAAERYLKQEQECKNAEATEHFS